MIDAICAWCVASAILTVIAFGLALARVASLERRFDMSRSMRVLLAVSMLTLAMLVAGATGGKVATFTGYDGAARRVLLSEWWTLWAVPPVEFALVVLLAASLAAAIRRVEPRRRGAIAFAVAAVVVLLLAIGSPVGGLAQGGMFAAHMSQHVLIGAVAPLLVLLAIPRARPAEARVHPLIAILTNPILAFLAWMAATFIWLLPWVHHQVYMHPAAWTLQQVSFFVFGIALWAPVTERFVAAPVWFGTGAKCLYMLGVWSVGLTLANIYWFAGSAVLPVSHRRRAILGSEPDAGSGERRHHHDGDPLPARVRRHHGAVLQAVPRGLAPAAAHRGRPRPGRGALDRAVRRLSGVGTRCRGFASRPARDRLTGPRAD